MSAAHAESVMTHVALIRGINVGRAKRVGMADLRQVFERLGCRNVRTLLNSGNVVFTSPASKLTADQIERAMAGRLGVSARVTLLSGEEFAAVSQGNPLCAKMDDPSRMLVAFVATTKDLAKLKPLLKQDWSPEALALGNRAAHLWCPGGFSNSRLSEAVGRLLGDGVTMRNWSTVLRIHKACLGGVAVIRSAL